MNRIAKMFGKLGRNLAPGVRAVSVDSGKLMEPRLIIGGATSPFLSPQPVEFDMMGPSRGWTHKRVTQLKVDGIQANYINGQIVSREGMPLNCARQCLVGLQRLEQAIGQECVFNAEYVEDAGFNATIRAMRKGEGQGVMWIYDFAPLGAWVTGHWDCPIEERLALLSREIWASASPFVGALDYWMLDGAETEAKARTIWAHGWEGLVSKEPGSIYERDHLDGWLKIKERIHVDGELADVAMRKDGRLGKIWVNTGPGQAPIIVSTGWDRHQEQLLILGMSSNRRPIVEVSHERTCGGDRSMRGARFERFRLDKMGAGR